MITNIHIVYIMINFPRIVTSCREAFCRKHIIVETTTTLHCSAYVHIVECVYTSVCLNHTCGINCPLLVYNKHVFKHYGFSFCHEVYT